MILLFVDSPVQTGETRKSPFGVRVKQRKRLEWDSYFLPEKNSMIVLQLLLCIDLFIWFINFLILTYVSFLKVTINNIEYVVKNQPDFIFVVYIYILNSHIFLPNFAFVGHFSTRFVYAFK